jgi:hypothetical protein
MRRPLAIAGTVLLVSLTVTGCGGDDAGAKAGSKATSSDAPSGLPSGLPTDLSSCLPTEIPSDLPTEIPSELANCLPTSLPTSLSTALPTETGVPSGAAFDSCSVVTKELIAEHFGTSPTVSAGQPSSLGDPNATDCYMAGTGVAVFVKATSRAAQDMPESSNLYASLPGAEDVPGADWGTAVAFGDGGLFALIMVKGQYGLDINLTVDSTDNDLATLQAFAQDVLAGL